MTDAFDVVIVGGGTTGCVLAARLSEDPALSVALIEAGNDPQLADMPEVVRYSRHWLPYDTRYMWSYEGRMMAHRGTTTRQLRGKVLGGSSTVNGAVALRGLAVDYDLWNSALWSSEVVLPYFAKLETDLDFGGPYHGKSGPIPIKRHPSARWSPLAVSFAETAASFGLPEKPDLNHPYGGGFGPLPFSLSSGERNSTARAYLGPARDRPNLTVLPGLTVTSIFFEGRRAVGVLAGAEGRRVRAEEVIVSAGVFGSPKLLMLSGIGDQAQLRSLGIEPVVDLPGVGRNLRCHPGLRFARLPAVPRTAGPTEPDFHVGLLYSSPGGEQRCDMQLLPRQVGDQVSFHLTVRVPDSTGQLLLTSADPAADLAIDYGFLHAEDRRRLTEGARMLDELTCHPALAWTSPHATDDLHAAVAAGGAELDDWIDAHAYAPYHACGTCKMGSEYDPAAVVGEHGRVFGVEGLRIFDGSVLPQSVRGGPYATTMMLGERAADLIRLALQKSTAA